MQGSPTTGLAATLAIALFACQLGECRVINLDEHLHSRRVSSPLAELTEETTSSIWSQRMGLMFQNASSVPSERKWPPFVMRLHDELDALQHPVIGRLTSRGSGCASPTKRFLVFEYGREEVINGFAAMFQHFAATLVLAHRYNRTLVELVPDSSHPGSDGATALNDPWRRAPNAVCHGAKMGCFLAQPSSCGLRLQAPTGSCTFTNLTVCVPHMSSLPDLDVECEEGLRDAVEGSSTRNCALQRLVKMSSIGAYQGATMHATSGLDAPAWFQAAGNAWACSGCSSSQGHTNTPLQNAFCRLHCRGPPQLAYRQYWFPAFEAYLFRPHATPPQLVPVATASPPTQLPLVGLHYRAGDAAVLPMRSHAPLQEYVANASAAALQLHSLTHQAAHLVFASDSASSREGMRKGGIPNCDAVHCSDVKLVFSLSPSGRTEDAHVHLETMLATMSASVGAGSKRKGAEHGKDKQTASSKGSAAVLLTPFSNVYVRTLTEQAIDTNAHPTDASAHSIGMHIAAFTQGVVSDIWQLSFSHAIVGTCLSQVSRVAYELAFLGGAALLPAVCPDLAQCLAHNLTHQYDVTLPWLG